MTDTTPVGPSAALGAGASVAFHRLHDTTFAGWAYDPADPARRFVVAVEVDGEIAALALADRFVQRLRDAFGGDGCHGFQVTLLPRQLEGAKRLRAVCANTGCLVGSLEWDAPGETALALSTVAGRVRWDGGLRLSGCVADLADPARVPELDIVVDGEVVLTVRPDLWRPSSPDEPAPGGRNGFSAILPSRFADGRPHAVRVVTADGEEPEGSPLTVLASGAGFEALAAEASREPDAVARGRLLDRLLPTSMSLDAFAAWRALYRPPPPPPRGESLAVVILGQEDQAVERTVGSLEAQSHPAWTAAVLSEDRGAIDPGAFRDAADAIGDVAPLGVVVVRAGTALDRDALAHLAAALAGVEGDGMIYADTAVEGPDGFQVQAKPAFDPHRLWSQGYVDGVVAIATPLFERVARAAPKSRWDIVLLAVWELGEDAGRRVLHLPLVLADAPAGDGARDAILLAEAVDADLNRRGVETSIRAAAGPALPALRVAPLWTRDPAGATVVLSAGSAAEPFRRALDSLAERRAGAAFDLVVVAEEQASHVLRPLLDQARAWGARVLAVGPNVSPSRAFNLALAAAEQPAVCLLEPGCEIVDDDWLAALLEPLAMPRVGAAGATMVWPDFTVRAAGLVLRPGLTPAPAFDGARHGDPGLAEALLAVRSVAALPLGCLVLGRDQALAIGGFDETVFPGLFADVDLSLRLRAEGFDTVVTPHVRVVQDAASPSVGRAGERALVALRRRWASAFVDDPFYSPLLNVDGPTFTGLAAPPRARAPRTPSRPVRGDRREAGSRSI